MLKSVPALWLTQVQVELKRALDISIAIDIHPLPSPSMLLVGPDIPLPLLHPCPAPCQIPALAVAGHCGILCVPLPAMHAAGALLCIALQHQWLRPSINGTYVPSVVGSYRIRLKNFLINLEFFNSMAMLDFF